MSGSSLPPSVGAGSGILGGWRVWAGIGVVLVFGAGVFVVLSWLSAVEPPPPPPRRPQSSSALAEFPLVPVVQRAAPAVITPPAQQAAMPLPPIRRPRPVPSPMALYTDRDPPRAPERPAPAAEPGEPRDMTLAGMRVLRPDVVPDPAWWLMPGAKIPCINREPITARTGAEWSGEVPEDVRSSTDGSKTLIPRGSIVVGRIVRGMQHGEMRVASVISHVQTAAGPGRPVMLVPMGDAAAGDAMGQVDLEGNVETHFWSRLGSVAAYAALDALAQAGGAVAGSAISDGLRGATGRGTSIGVYSFNGIGSRLAGQEYQRQMSQGPSFERPQGQACTVFIGRPIDFRIMQRFQ